ncbi:MAG: SMP-30/gluconolactonase/LRE family protein [Rhodospirillaceae bacterium]|nr:SMP-30/gluconolactonase/LRE family protein [Rhodospirillaceae bacterium]
MRAGRALLGRLDAAQLHGRGRPALPARARPRRGGDGRRIHRAQRPGWSPDGSVFYIADSPAGAIFRYAFDPAGGAPGGGVLGPRAVAVEPGLAPGWPDGMAVDAEGCLWSARWDGGCVVRFTPGGAVDRIVDMPVSRPTSCAFAGPGLDILVVTSGTAGMDEAARAAEPLAGGLFAFNPGVSGAPVGTFSG